MGGQKEEARMNKIKKVAAAILCFTIALGGLSNQAFAEETKWDIENTLDISDCKQGSTVTMSVTLKGSGTAADKPQEIASINGTLEYDNSLFTVEKADILPVESGKAQNWSFDKETGTFHIQYASSITVPNDGMLLQIKLHTAADATTGKTTLCVTQLKWGNAAGQETEVEHRVPARITIAQAQEEPEPGTQTATGDVNLDGKVNLTDAKLVMQYYNGAKTLDTQQLKNADVNGDGKANLTDAKMIMRYYNGEVAGF